MLTNGRCRFLMPYPVEPGEVCRDYDTVPVGLDRVCCDRCADGVTPPCVPRRPWLIQYAMRQRDESRRPWAVPVTG